MTTVLRRRTVLRTAGVATFAGLSGCLGGNEDGEGTDETDGNGGDNDSTGSDTADESTRIVIFRNDDIQANYMFDTMVAVDDVFREEGVPISLGVIPHGIDEDERVCTYLRDLDPDLFEIALHGYDHEAATDFGGGSEFGDLDRATQHEKIETGTEILEACTGKRPRTFIPPFNTYDETTAEVLVEEGYTLASASIWFYGRYYDDRGPLIEDDLIHLGTDLDFVEDWGTHEFYTQEDLRASFDAAYEEGRIHMPMIHFQTFDGSDDIEELRSFIQYVDEHDVQFMTLAGFAENYRSGGVQRTDDGWTVVEDATNNSFRPNVSRAVGTGQSLIRAVATICR